MKRLMLLFALCILCTGCRRSAQDLLPQSESIPEASSSLESEAVSEESSELSSEAGESSSSAAPAPGSIIVEQPAPPASVVEQIPSSSTAEQSASSSAAKTAPYSSVSEAAPSSSAAAPETSSSSASSSLAPAESSASVRVNDLVSVEHEVIRLINAERAAKGLSQLQIDDNLTKSALIRSEELYRNDYFAHTRPNGDAWQTVLQQDVPVGYYTAGENLAKVEHNMPDYDPAYDANYWYNTWENSPTHYENMINPGFTHVGVGICRYVRNGLIVAHATTHFASYSK